jgi:hypothetical protein
VSLKDFKRMLETEAAEGLVAWLRAQGQSVEDVRWPDREREGRPAGERGTKTIDLTFRLDDRAVGVEITELHESSKHARQHALMGSVAGDLERELRPRLLELRPDMSIMVSWDLSWLPAARVLAKGLQQVRTAILEAAPRLASGQPVEVLERPGFVARMEIQCWGSETPKFGFVTMHEEQTMWVGQAAESMADGLLASGKAEQLAAFDDARVLAIDRALMPIPAELQAAFDARLDRIPSNWTAIYFVIAGAPGSLAEVWRR